jgi:hypothetical protein
MDPATISLIFGGAKMAYEAIKSGISVGKEIQGMAADVAKLYGSVAKLTQLSAQTPRPALFSGVTVEEMAMDIVVKRKQAQAWFHEVQNAFVAQYGLRGWDEVQREIVHIQKQQKAAQLQAQREHEENMHQLKMLGMAGLAIVFAIVAAITLFTILHN